MSSIIEESRGELHLPPQNGAAAGDGGCCVTAVEIQNYKSARDLKLELARFTVLIGENGCGKSNILEAIALGGAAAARKLDHEFLASRGIRVTDPPLMRSGFDGSDPVDDVVVRFHCQNGMSVRYSLSNKNEPYSEWSLTGDVEGVPSPTAADCFSRDATGDDTEVRISIRGLEHLQKKVVESEPIVELALSVEDFLGQDVRQFLIYSPENSALRTFESERQIQPLGIRGEGLFKLLTVFAREPEQRRLRKLNGLLRLVDWFRDFTVPDRLSPGQQSISITDRYLGNRSELLDQRSANEGFLFLLFYFALFLSDRTPSFFAIDNVDTSLNPKLCAELTRVLARLCKEHDKRVIVTTHNPAILDGLDLEDSEQRLMVVYRSGKGHTVANRVRPLRPLPGQEPVRLSEAFIRGYLGGLPGNF